jgi:putative Mg2+ transporter-C (MgtC) family protein
MTLEFIWRLLAAFGCGVAIGLERQLRQRTAGLRTITLVATGACLFVSLGVLMNSGVTQVAAYVVSGVGFLGGGVIMRDKGAIQGINTAATLWCAAAVGVLSGTGYFGPAVAGTVLVLVTNTVLREVSRAINSAPIAEADIVREYQLVIVCLDADEAHIRAMLSNAMSMEPLAFKSLSSRNLENPPQNVEVRAVYDAHPRDHARLERVASRISMEKGVSSVSWSASEAALVPE